MKQLIYFFLLTTLFCFARADGNDTLDFLDCGSVFFVDMLKIEDCYTEQECVLYIGGNKSISFELRTVGEANQLRHDVYLYARGFKWYLDATPDPCEVVPCPVVNEYSTTYYATIFVDDTYLQMKGDLYWVMYDDSSNQLVCFSTAITVLFGKEPLQVV